MLVHLTGSIRDLETDPPVFRAITQVIHDTGGVLALSWIDTMIQTLKDDEAGRQALDWSTIVADNLSAIERADIVIIEATKYNFSQGFQLAAAFEHNKPVLFVFKGQKPGSMMTGFDNQLFTYKSYSDMTDLKKHVERFLQKNTIRTKDLRFNFFIDKKIDGYLEEISQETGRNKSEIIRDILKRKMKKNES